MNQMDMTAMTGGHSHVFLGEAHEASERKTWTVIVLCGVMMLAEILGGLLFGSIALVADGLHMSTHAGALLLAAMAYSYSRKHAQDPRYTFGTGKFGDLAGFTSAIVLAMIALLIGYESIGRLFSPIPIHFGEAIPIAILGLLVNVGSVFLLSGDHHHHGHSHGHGHDEHDHDHDDERRVVTPAGPMVLRVFEDGVPPVFRLSPDAGSSLPTAVATVETVRPGGARQIFAMVQRGSYLESSETIAEPHAFEAIVSVAGTASAAVVFEEHHDHGHENGDDHDHAAHRDNNMRAAIIHVMADAAVSVLVIVGLLLARTFGWLWMDPLAGIAGALVIASWAYGLVRDTGAILLDMTPDRKLAEKLRSTVEGDGDRVTDLHLWRLGPGHLGAILAVASAKPRSASFYKAKLSRFRNLSHVTVEVEPVPTR